MLSYQHAYHAGNHADLLKHFVLLSVLENLKKKDKPFTFFDTHSGSGLYDLYDNCSLKTGEAAAGVEKLFEKIKENQSASGFDKDNCENEKNYPEELSDYINFVQKYVDKMMYPGSPEIEFKNMRKDDVLVLSELHPQEIEKLKNNLQKNQNKSAVSGEEKKLPQLQIHKRNGWEMIKALTPPKTKRGGVLIDPSYEETEDYINASKTIIEVFKKWTNGIIMLWYPLLAHRENDIEQMLDSIKTAVYLINQNVEICDLRLCVNEKSAHKQMSLEEFRTTDSNPSRLYGSGMLVINAPWKLQENSETVIKYLEKLLQNK